MAAHAIPKRQHKKKQAVAADAAAVTVIAETNNVSSIKRKSSGYGPPEDFLYTHITPNKINPTVFIAKFANICTNQDG